MAEIIRGGLMSVDHGQTEAAACLGMKPSLLTRRIILPQAMRMIIPPIGNETINLLKTTSLVSIIAVGDLLYSAQSIYARTFETIPLLIVVTFWYQVVVSIMSVGQTYLERYYSREETGGNPRPFSGALPEAIYILVDAFLAKPQRRLRCMEGMHGEVLSWTMCMKILKFCRSAYKKTSHK